MSYELIAKKLTEGEIFKCDLKKFISTITVILPFSGASMSKLYLCEYDGVRFLTKMSFYRKTPMELYGKPSKHLIPETDAEIRILTSLRDNIIRKNLSPGILELVMVHTCTDQLLPTIKECSYNTKDTIEDGFNTNLCKYADLVKSNLAHNKFSFLVLEGCEMTFLYYLMNNMMTPAGTVIFKSMLFIIIHTRYIIDKIYPRFTHRDLHTDNVMVKFDFRYKFDIFNPKFLVFNVGEIRYCVPYFGIIPKIIDFGHSSLPEENIESEMQGDLDFTYRRSHNDLLLLFNHI